LPVLSWIGFAKAEEEVNPPFKFRMNKGLFESIIDSGDHKIVEAFADLQLGEVSSGDIKLENVSCSMAQREGELKDVKFDTLFSNEAISASSGAMKFTGSFKLGEQEVLYEAPIDRIAVEFLSKTDQFEKQDLIGQISAAGITLSPSQGSSEEAIKQALQERLVQVISDYDKSLMGADMETLLKSPIALMAPFGLTYLAGLGAKKIEIMDDYIDYGLSPRSFIPMFGEKVTKNLKKIAHDFSADYQNTGFSVIIDENLPNMFIRQFTYNEKSYSMRQKMGKGPRGP